MHYLNLITDSNHSNCTQTRSIEAAQSLPESAEDKANSESTKEPNDKKFAKIELKIKGGLGQLIIPSIKWRAEFKNKNSGTNLLKDLLDNGDINYAVWKDYFQTIYGSRLPDDVENGRGEVHIFEGTELVEYYDNFPG